MSSIPGERAGVCVQHPMRKQYGKVMGGGRGGEGERGSSCRTHEGAGAEREGGLLAGSERRRSVIQSPRPGGGREEGAAGAQGIARPPLALHLHTKCSAPPHPDPTAPPHPRPRAAWCATPASLAPITDGHPFFPPPLQAEDWEHEFNPDDDDQDQGADSEYEDDPGEGLGEGRGSSCSSSSSSSSSRGKGCAGAQQVP